MTEENQTSSDNTAPKYRALVNGTGYRKNDILAPVESEHNGSETGIIIEREPHAYYHCKKTGFAPVFHRLQLEASPDFELVEESPGLWIPESRYYSVTSLDQFLKGQQLFKTVNESEYQVMESAGLVFRHEIELTNALTEALTQLQKRSKESRRLNADTKAD